MPNRCIQPGDNQDLTEERKSCQFDTDELAFRIYGSKKIIEDQRRILKAVEGVPELQNLKQDLEIPFMSHLEKFENSYKKNVLAEKYMDQIIDRNDVNQYEYYQKLVNGTSGYPFALKHVIVIPLLENSADDEQRKLFLEPAKRHEFSSAYAQTELGHGTNTKQLETTATYDPKTEEFVLNSPTITSLKWWPGNLGKTASIAIVMADLRINNKSYGMHPFFVRIRDEETHELLPGIVAGDIGPTFAFTSANDNGYLGFKQFRTPKKSMLMKHFKVHPNGEYEMAIHPRLAYTGMMFVRSSMIFDCGYALAAGAIIATRYSLIRRQGEINAGKGEVKILQYKTQQYRILPQLSRAICFCFAGHFVTDLYNQVMTDIKTGDASKMASLHAITSGLKSVCSYQTSIGVEQCRLSCGGHGYSAASGLPQILTKVVAGCTYEGDNLVMLLQLSRYLVKCAKEVRNGKKSNKDKLVQYLYEPPKYRSNFNVSSTQTQQWAQIQEAFEHLSQKLTLKAYDSFNSHKAKDSKEVAWNKASVDLTKASRAHTRTFLSSNFIKTVLNEKNQEIREVLSDLLDLYLRYEVFDCRADLLENNFMDNTHMDQLRDQLNTSLSRVRQNAINIADSFDIPDRILCSVLGRRDGHVWKNLFNWAQQSELNQTQVLPFHHKTLGRMMEERKFLSKM